MGEYYKRNKKQRILMIFLLLGIVIVMTGLYLGFIALTSDSDENAEGNAFYVTISIDCKSILNNRDKLATGLDKYLGFEGTILSPVRITCYEGENVWDALNRTCRAYGLTVEVSRTGNDGPVYVETLNHLYERCCGDLSGWCYSVNGEFPNVSCSEYPLKDGDVIAWRFTCDLGNDLGNDVENNAGGSEQQ